MNVFNRSIMALLSIVALAAGIIIILLTRQLIMPDVVSPNGLLLQQWRFFTHLNSTDMTTTTFVGITLIGGGIVILILELLPGKRRVSQFIVKRDALGQITVARSSVRDLIRHEALQITGIVDTSQTVEEDAKGLHVQVRASLMPDVAAPEIGKKLQERVQSSVQLHIGLPVSEVQVFTQLEPLEKRVKRRVR